MILVFGGTTEGRKAINELEEAGATYYYSTKTGEQDVTLHHGVRIDGALDRQAMLTFCREHDIQLMIDASHPFAQQLHQTVASVADELRLPLIRFERIFPEHDKDIEWIDDYDELSRLKHIRTLLATTGVQSISKLKPLEQQGIKVIYRILPRESSILLAHQQGATDSQLCFYDEDSELEPIADTILLKESGITGGFLKKTEQARRLGMRIIAIRRPAYPQLHHASVNVVNGEHGLRRMVEKLLPDFFPLHSGLTTGTCATAAAIAATLQLLQKKDHSPSTPHHSPLPTEVPVILPNGETIPVAVNYGDGYAYVIKDSGDDPDVTKGIEIRAEVRGAMENGQWIIDNGKWIIDNGQWIIDNGKWTAEEAIQIVGGEGIGTFTLPGFDYPPGESAINKGPRAMIRQNLSQLSIVNYPLSIIHHPLTVTLSVPNGAEIAQRTFNPRLGIVGGISIVGVSGIIKPFSEEAFIDSIRKCMEVAKASGTNRVVINSGAKSERFVKALYPTLPQQAFVEYGNYIGETLRIAHELKIPNITLGVMLGKAVKLAEGQLDTHSKKGTMNKAFIAQMLEEACSQPGTASNSQLENITLARELWDLIPEDQLQTFANVVIAHCEKHCRPLLPDGQLTILLITDDGRIYKKAPTPSPDGER